MKLLTLLMLGGAAVALGRGRAGAGPPGLTKRLPAGAKLLSAATVAKLKENGTVPSDAREVYSLKPAAFTQFVGGIHFGAWEVGPRLYVVSEYDVLAAEAVKLAKSVGLDGFG